SQGYYPNKFQLIQTALTYCLPAFVPGVKTPSPMLLIYFALIILRGLSLFLKSRFHKLLLRECDPLLLVLDILSLIVCHLILVVSLKHLILDVLLALALLKPSNDQYRHILQFHLSLP